jgi:curved DNA-binding protein
MTTADALRVLGVSGGADADTLRAAFRDAAKRAHPDHPGGDGERLRLIIEAYRTLRPKGAPLRRGAPRRLTITPAEAMLGGWRPVELAEGRQVTVRLPPGLREGEALSVDGQPMSISIAGEDGQAVLGDHLCVTAEVPLSLTVVGGRVVVETPTGPQSFWVSADDGARGLARARGLGLPPRGRYARGDLYVWLRAVDAPAAETLLEAKLRRFSAEWAA